MHFVWKCCLSLEDAFVTRDVMFSDVSLCDDEYHKTVVKVMNVVLQDDCASNTPCESFLLVFQQKAMDDVCE